MASNTKMEDLLARIATAMDLLAVAAPRSSVALQSNVASSATSVIVLAANQYRVGAGDAIGVAEVQADIAAGKITVGK